MTRVVIRDAVPGDMAALGEVFRRASLSNEGDRAQLLAHPEVLELSDRGVREGRTRAAVADGQIVGFASWLGAGEAFEIEDLFVDPGWMRQGIGRALVLDLIAIARDRGIGRVEVTRTRTRWPSTSRWASSPTARRRPRSARRPGWGST